MDDNERFSLGEGGEDQETHFLRKWNVKDGHEEVDMRQEWRVDKGCQSVCADLCGGSW
jgi:hypothetical protein